MVFQPMFESTGLHNQQTELLAQGRGTTPDMAIMGITDTNGGSISNGVTNFLAVNSHTIRVDIENNGAVAGQSTLSLHYYSSAIAAPVLVGSVAVDLNPFEQESHTFIHPVTVTGPDQKFAATLTDAGEDDLTDNYNEFLFTVQSIEDGELLGNSLPAVSVPPSRIGLGVHTYEATIRNAGNVPIQAEFTMLMTSLSDGTQMPLTSTPASVVLQPGNIAGIATAQNVSVSFDSASMVGTWWMNATVTFTGVSSEVIDLTPRMINFSEFRARIIPPPDQGILPGSSGLLTYLITNTGDVADSYAVSVWDSKGWAFPIAAPPSLSLQPGEGGASAISITVPSGEASASSSIVYLNITSLDGYQLHSYAVVMAGNLVTATITANIAPLLAVPVSPGNQTPIPFLIENSGNAPGRFDIVAGLASSAEDWSVSVSATRTSILNPGSSETVLLILEPPPLSNPLNPAHQLLQGTQSVAWMQATATDGGVPTVGQVDVEVKPIIVIDPGLEEQELTLTEGQIKFGESIQAVDVALEMRHNMVADPGATVGANIALGTPVFTPSGGAGGASEASRWSVGITPTSHSAPLIDPVTDSPVFSSLTLLQPNQDGLMPLAGELNISVTSSVSNTDSLVVDTSEVTRYLIVDIPGYIDAGITETGPQNALPSVASTFDLNLTNLGNDYANLTLQASASDGWIVTFGTSSFTGLAPEMSNWPDIGDSHVGAFSITVTPPADSTDGHVENIIISVINTDTGDIVLEHSSPVTIGAQYGATLTPAIANISVEPLGTATTILLLNNTGNTLTIFDVTMNVPDGTPINITMSGAPSIVLKAGRVQDIRFQIQALEGAIHDTTYVIPINVASGENINLTSTIEIKVLPEHNLTLEMAEIFVTPGMVEVASYSVANGGNLIENLDVGVYLATNWNTTLSPSSLQLELASTQNGSFTIEVPPISAENMLYNGDQFAMWFSLKDTATGEELINHTQQITVRPFFALVVENWTNEYLFLPGDQQIITANLKNTGNADIVVNISAAIEPDTGQWEIIEAPPNAINLALGEEQLVSVTVRAGASEYYFQEVSVLNFTVIPVEAEVAGQAEFNANLIMERILDSEHEVSGQATVIDIPFSHVPSQAEYNTGGYPIEPEYVIELVSMERFIDTSTLNLDNESLYEWTFTLLSASGGAAALMEGQPLSLEGRARHSQSPGILIQVNASNVEGVLPGDGYNLTVRVTHPTDGTSTLVDIRIPLANFADPFVKTFTFQDGQTGILEGDPGQIVVVVKNGGTALAPFVDVELVCEGRIQIYSQEMTTKPVMALDNSKEVELIWDVDARRLDWWQTSEPVDCKIILHTVGAIGNVESNDIKSMEASVVSWSPTSSVVTVGAVMALFVITIFMIQMGREREQFAHMAAYTGCAMLGMAFHLSEWVLLGPLLLVASVLWLVFNAWRASDELQIIHADYQRSRLGLSSIFQDHYKQIARSRRQLNIIFTLPILGFIFTILGFPPLVSTNILNALTLIAMVLVTYGAVFLTLKATNKIFGQVYDRLAKVQIRLRSIERSLGDPARLLNEIANIDLEAVLEDSGAGGGEND